MISEVSKRYASAIFDLCQANKSLEKSFAEIRIVADVIRADSTILDFINSPLVSPEAKATVLKNTLQNKVSEDVLSLMLVLCEKNRLGIFIEVAEAFEQINDEAHGVTRGMVKSATMLGSDQRKQIEQTVNKVTGKKVILNFEQDPSLLGGMIAQVSGWTFDDSLLSHLNRMSDELNRRTH